MVFFYYYVDKEDGDTRYIMYMGRDKHENEDLIKYSFDEDIWFHVDALSSAHVYLRPPSSKKRKTEEDGEDHQEAKKAADAIVDDDEVASSKRRRTDRVLKEKALFLDSIPPRVVKACSLMVKANSIEGCKRANVRIVYTSASNLMKTHDMEIGQVSFHSQKLVRHTAVDKPSTHEVVNALNRTRVEKPTSFIKEMWDKRQKQILKKEKLRKQKAEAARTKAIKLAEEEMRLRSYEGVMDAQNMESNKDMSGKDFREVEDDFM